MENTGIAKQKTDFNFKLSFSGTILAVVSGFAAMLAGIGSRMGLWHFDTGFEILRWSVYGCVVALLVSISGLAFVINHRTRCLVVGVPGIIICLTVITISANLWFKARNLPPIHDITTDLSNPPQLVALLSQRSGATNSSVYGGAEIAVKQLQAYPDIKPMVLEIPADRAYDDALAAARRMGWEVVADDKKDWRIEATDTTFWFGFTDDIVIRVTPAGGRSIIDIRSVSRVGKSDLGKNAERIRCFFQQLRRIS